MLKSKISAQGFTLLELIIAMSIFAILVVMAVPNFAQWIANSKVRTVAEAMQNGLRLAEAEAVRQNRRVQFSLTNGTPSTSATAVAGGINWMILTVPLLAEQCTNPPTCTSYAPEVATFVEGGQFSNLASNVVIASTDSNGVAVATVTFSAFGQIVPNLPTGIAYPVTFNISIPSGNRPLNVRIYSGGEIRLCDPAKSIATSPDGC